MAKSKKIRNAQSKAAGGMGIAEMKSISNAEAKPQPAESLIVDDRFGHEIVMLPIEQITPNDYNPNKMSSALFDELARDMEETGVLSAIVVAKKEDGSGYEIIDGEHRYEIARLKDLKQIPCIIVKGKLAESRDERIFETMRMNTLRGQVDYKKLKDVVKELSEKHGIGEIAERLLFADEQQLLSLIEDVRTTLPSEEMRKEFDRAKADLKTVDDLTLLIKRLFSKYGDTLEYGYMFLDYGGKDSIWIRISNRQEYRKLAACIEKVKTYGVTADSAVVTLLTEGLTDAFFEAHKGVLTPALNTATQDDAYMTDIDDEDVATDNELADTEQMSENPAVDMAAGIDDLDTDEDDEE